MLRRLARFFLAAAFLAAQTAGVAHQAWHDVSPFVAHSDEAASDSKAPQKSPLCDFHTALSAVLGAVNGASQAVVPAAVGAIDFADVESDAARFSGLVSRSRGPPTLL